MISCLAGFSIYILSYLSESNNLLIAFSLFAFITNLIREIIKDAEDVKGDLLLNAKTLPIVLGETKAKIVISGLSLVFLGFLWMAYFQYANMRLGVSVLIISGLIAYVQYVLWTSVNNRIAFKQSSQTLKIIMLVGCLSIPLL